MAIFHCSRLNPEVIIQVFNIKRFYKEVVLIDKEVYKEVVLIVT